MPEAALILPDGTSHALDEELSVGRSADNDLTLTSTGVSRHHARFSLHGTRWFVEDRGSLHGTHVNGVRLQPGLAHPLRHADRVDIAGATLVFSAESATGDPDDTAHFDVQRLAASRPLSPFQAQVVRTLCEPWLAGGSADDLPSNEEIAARLGTPGATESVKAALRRVYAKAGLGDDSTAGKRRKLCVVARRRGWI